MCAIRHNGIPIPRRKKRRIVGEMTFPTEVHSKVLKQMLQEKLQIGMYSIGERIVPTKVGSSAGLILTYFT